MKNTDQVVNIFEDGAFAEFRGVLDGKLKQLNRTVKYVEKRKAELITAEMEDKLWESGLLGDHSPQVLVDTLVYLNGLNFALRSGEEHWRLRHNPSQTTVVRKGGMVPYIVYNEDISKTNQGELKSRKLTPKRVIHHDNPLRCLVHLFLRYSELCPNDHPDNALYLTPSKNPTENCWYSHVPIGHNKLAETIPRLLKQAGVPGFFTNHSLRATSTTRMYEAQLDEASIMQRTGHRSVNGVRAYKRRTDKLEELMSTVLNGTIVKTPKVEEKTSIKEEQKENKEKVCPNVNLPTMPWNFEGASGFTINFNFK